MAHYSQSEVVTIGNLRATPAQWRRYIMRRCDDAIAQKIPQMLVRLQGDTRRDCFSPRTGSPTWRPDSGRHFACAFSCWITSRCVTWIAVRRARIFASARCPASAANAWSTRSFFKLGVLAGIFPQHGAVVRSRTCFSTSRNTQSGIGLARMDTRISAICNWHLGRCIAFTCHQRCCAWRAVIQHLYPN